MTGVASTQITSCAFRWLTYWWANNESRFVGVTILGLSSIRLNNLPECFYKKISFFKSSCHICEWKKSQFFIVRRSGFSNCVITTRRAWLIDLFFFWGVDVWCICFHVLFSWDKLADAVDFVPICLNFLMFLPQGSICCSFKFRYCVTVDS